MPLESPEALHACLIAIDDKWFAMCVHFSVKRHSSHALRVQYDACLACTSSTIPSHDLV